MRLEPPGPTADDLREILSLGLGAGEHAMPSTAGGVPLLLYPCDGAKFIEVQIRYECAKVGLTVTRQPSVGATWEHPKP